MTTIRRFLAGLLVLMAVACIACGPREASAPTAADARQFLDTVNDTMKADWVQKNFITDDTEALQARVN
jgi:hypothetical protein